MGADSLLGFCLGADHLVRFLQTIRTHDPHPKVG